MTKQQPFATKLNLSKFCRIIMVLAMFKISLLSAMFLDLSLLNIKIPSFFDSSVVAKEANNSSSPIITASNNMENNSQAQGLENIATASAQAAQKRNAANWDINNGTFPVSTAVQGKKNSSPSFFNSNNNDPSLEYELLSAGIDASNASSPHSNNKKSWWKNMLSIKNLPIPGFGTVQVAHAAALDNPPAPSVASPTGLTNFTPNSQRDAVGQDTVQENNAPVTSTTPLKAAGTAGPKVTYQPTTTNDITKRISPPAPNINAYSPKEDPHAKQKELARREQDLLMLKKQMEQRYSELQAAEEKVNKLLKSANNKTEKKSSNLVSVYANMKPKQAAIALGKVDERVAVQILSGLSPKQAGEILSYADPDVTAKLTELLTRVQP